MIELNEDEATELRERLRQSPEAQPAEETIAVSANASSSVRSPSRKKGLCSRCWTPGSRRAERHRATVHQAASRALHWAWGGAAVRALAVP